MSTTTQPLKYHWIAEYADGDIFEQPEDDKSKNHDDSKKWNPSSFRDIDQDRLVAFHLTDGKNQFSVNMKSGEFAVNGVAFTVHEQNFNPAESLKLIFFREVLQHSVGGEVQAPYVNRYYFGWQAKDHKGNNHTHTMGVG